MRDHWRSKYADAQIAFTQSPSLRNNRRILDIWFEQLLQMSMMFTIFTCTAGPRCEFSYAWWRCYSGRTCDCKWNNGTAFPRCKDSSTLARRTQDWKRQNLWVRQCAVRFAAWLKDLLHWTHLSSGELHLKFLSLSFILTIENSLLHILDDFVLTGPVGAFSTVGAKMGFKGGGTCVT